MLEHTELDVYTAIAVQPLASSCVLSGCYQNVYQTSGALQQFITTCVVVGRAMCSSNKHLHVKHEISNSDSCSLYPSAINIMLGSLMGKPNVLHNTSYDFV